MIFDRYSHDGIFERELFGKHLENAKDLSIKSFLYSVIYQQKLENNSINVREQFYNLKQTRFL